MDNLQDLTLSQIEMALRVVSESLECEQAPQMLSPPDLVHLTDLQWQSLYWAHRHLMMQRASSPLH